MRQSKVTRETAETKIDLTLTLDAEGKSEIKTGCGFLDHMLTLFARHGHFDLALTCEGDTDVDFHHTTEDIGICLGCAFKEALADKAGIVRYADTTLPMDESLILTALDFSGRGYFACELDIKAQKVGDFDTELVKEFVMAFARELGLTIHFKMFAGENSHHIIEAVFKGMGRAMRAACAIEEEFADEIPSTKGVL
jgi:imidazoleglycerol-phosphate dehydratase